MHQENGDGPAGQQLASWAQAQAQMQAQMQMPMPQIEMDPVGTELGNWLYENQQMLNFLDDGYHFC